MPDLKEDTSLSEVLSGAHDLVKLDQCEEATGIYLSIIGNDPKHIVALKEIGVLYSRMGKVGNAIEYLSKAVELEPDNKDLLEQLQAAINELEVKPELEWPIE